MNRLLQVSVFAGVTLILFAKAPHLYLRPPLAYEDGRDLFSFYFEHREPESILRSYNGYVSLVPNLAGYCAAWMPLRFLPRTYSFCALFFNSLALGLFCTNRFRPIVPSDAARAAVCLFLAIMPLGDYAVLTTAMYSLWPLLLTLLLMLLVPFGGNGALRVGIVVGLSLCVCSHPLSIVAMPVLVFNCWRHSAWRERSMNIALLGVTAVYLAFGTSPRASPDWPASLRSTGAIALERVYLESVVGALRRLAWHGGGHPPWLNICLGATCLALYCAILLVVRSRVDRQLLAPILILNYLIWALTVGSVLGRGLTDSTLLEHYFPTRYTFIQEFCWLLALSMTAVRLAPQCIVTPTVRRLATAAIFAFATTLSVENRVLWEYDVGGMAGNEVREFMRQVEWVQRNVPASARPIELALERDIWSVRIGVR
ncbi:MAG TPA: hypothetical protein VHC22_14325 [Pirellulales bacterium]|nr:hypothetical protein [Pirellulales bacterium]